MATRANDSWRETNYNNDKLLLLHKILISRSNVRSFVFRIWAQKLAALTRTRYKTSNTRRHRFDSTSFEEATILYEKEYFVENWKILSKIPFQSRFTRRITLNTQWSTFPIIDSCWLLFPDTNNHRSCLLAWERRRARKGGRRMGGARSKGNFWRESWSGASIVRSNETTRSSIVNLTCRIAIPWPRPMEKGYTFDWTWAATSIRTTGTGDSLLSENLARIEVGVEKERRRKSPSRGKKTFAKRDPFPTLHPN